MAYCWLRRSSNGDPYLWPGLLRITSCKRPPAQQPGPSAPAESSPEEQPDSSDKPTDKKDEAISAPSQPAPTVPGKKKSGGSSGGSSSGGSGGGSSGGGSGGDTPVSCELPNYPNASCTGPTGALAACTGSLDFYTDGEVVENVEIHLTSRGLYVPANNVTFRNVKIVWDGPRGGDDNIVQLNNNSGTVFESCELDGKDNMDDAIRGLTAVNTTVRKCNIHNVANGVEVTGGNLLVEENYIHDIRRPPGETWHSDGVQAHDGDDNVTIRHNTIILTGGETAAITLQADGANTSDNVLIENNLLGGSSWTLYVGPGNNYQVLNNHFTTQIWPRTAQFGIWANLIGFISSGNVIHETGVSANDDNW